MSELDALLAELLSDLDDDEDPVVESFADAADFPDPLALDEEEEGEAPAAKETPEGDAEGGETKAEVKAEEGEPPKEPAEVKADEKPPEAPAESKPETEPAPDTPKPEEEEVPPQQPDLEAVTAEFTKWRGEAETMLAEHHYGLSDEQVQELEDDDVPESLIKAIPVMMSRVYLDAVTAAMGQITTHLPQLITMVTDRQAQQTREEGEFFEEWPALTEHGDTVRRMGHAYRQANPNVTKEKFITEVGASVMVALQLPIEGAGEPAAATEVKAKPFLPAAKGTPASAAAEKKGEFELLNDEFDGAENLDLD